MNIREYQQYVRDGVKNNSNDLYEKQLSIIGLIGETGEVADIIKKMCIYSDMSLFEKKYGMSVEDKMKEEIGDVLWQTVNILNKFNLDIEDVIKANVEKLNKRHGGIKPASDGGKR